MQLSPTYLLLLKLAAFGTLLISEQKKYRIIENENIPQICFSKNNIIKMQKIQKKKDHGDMLSATQ